VTQLERFRAYGRLHPGFLRERGKLSHDLSDYRAVRHLLLVRDYWQPGGALRPEVMLRDGQRGFAERACQAPGEDRRVCGAAPGERGETGQAGKGLVLCSRWSGTWRSWTIPAPGSSIRIYHGAKSLRAPDIIITHWCGIMTGWCCFHPADPLPFSCQMPISWYEDFPRISGRAGHAQFACLCGAQHIVTAPQYPGTGGGEVAGLRGSRLVAGRICLDGTGLDWTSTEECLRRSWCREGELPTALVKSKVGFAAFEAGTSGLSILAQ
jgi:hypothetical protein